MKNLLIAAMLVSSGMANSVYGASVADNVAKGKTAAASSGNAALAVDGNVGTNDSRWNSALTDNEWFYVDLEKNYALDGLQLVWEGAYTKTYEILVAEEMTATMQTNLSDEDRTNDFAEGWTVVKTVDETLAAPFPYTQDVAFDGRVNGRYVAFHSIERGTIYGNSFWEFRVLSYGEYLADGTTEVAKVVVEDGLSVYVGETAAPEAAAVDGQNFRVAGETVTLSCADSGITVADNVVTGVTPGTYTLVGTASNGVTGTAEFVVREKDVLSELSISANIVKGATTDVYEFSVTAKNQYGENYQLKGTEWIVDGSGTAVFDGNKMTVDSRGRYVVKLQSEGMTSNEVTVEVVAEGSNLALSKTVVSSTDGSLNPQNAVDGNDDSLWEIPNPAGNTTFEYEAEIVIDLGEEFSVNCVHAYWEGASSADYTVTFSIDNVNFTEAAEAFTVVGGIGGGGMNRHDWLVSEQSVSARYVKLLSTKAATQYGTKLREIEVYSNSELAPAELRHVTITAEQVAGRVEDSYPIKVSFTDQYGEDYTLTPDEAATAEWIVSGGGEVIDNAFKAAEKGAYTVRYRVNGFQSEEIEINVVAEGENILKNRVIVSETDGAVRPAKNAIDGDGGSEWFIKDGGNSADFEVEFTIDFEVTANINAVHLNWEGANAAEYEILFSNDGENFTVWKAFSETPNVRSRHDWLWNETTTATRYVKFRGKKAANGGYGYRLFEMEAYGANNEDVSGIDAPERKGAAMTVAGDVLLMSEQMAEVTVYGLNGGTVAAAAQVTEMNISSLQQGVYIVRAVNAAGEVFTAKIIR